MKSWTYETKPRQTSIRTFTCNQVRHPLNLTLGMDSVIELHVNPNLIPTQLVSWTRDSFFCSIFVYFFSVIYFMNINWQYVCVCLFIIVLSLSPFLSLTLSCQMIAQLVGLAACEQCILILFLRAATIQTAVMSGWTKWPSDGGCSCLLPNPLCSITPTHMHFIRQVLSRTHPGMCLRVHICD